MKKRCILLLHRLLVWLLTEERGHYWEYWQWRFIGWGKIGSPWRMTAEEQACYEAQLQSIGRGASVLILGATPELRILAARAGACVTCADFSVPMLERMGVEAERAVPGAARRESWFVGDWLALPFPGNHFDLALGDMVLPFVGRGDRAAFLDRIARALKPGGRFLTRVHVIDERTRNARVEECIAAFPIPELWGKSSPRGIAAALNVMLLDRSVDIETGLTNRAKMIADVRAYKPRGAGMKERVVLKALLKNYAVGIDFNFELREALERDLERRFKIESVSTSSDYAIPALAPATPFYVLKKK